MHLPVRASLLTPSYPYASPSPSARPPSTNTPPSVAVEIASHIDTITLDSLARTCRAAHAGLIQYRRALLASTLRCHQDPLPVDPKDTFRFRARASEWYLQSRPSPRLRNYNGKAGTCARDMVSECRRCLKVVCRVSVSTLGPAQGCPGMFPLIFDPGRCAEGTGLTRRLELHDQAAWAKGPH